MTHTNYLLLLTTILLIVPGTVVKAYNDGQKSEDAPDRILVYSKTDGPGHESIEHGKEALIKLGKENGVEVDTTEDASKLNKSNLEKYSAVVFLSPSGNLLNEEQKQALKAYIQNGGGFAGIHAASTIETEWPWYNKLVGAYFDGHPSDPLVRSAKLNVVDRNHPATEHLPRRWERADEWYNFKKFYDWVNVIMTLDTDTYEGSNHEFYHPVAWYHEFDGGRSFYTALGHTAESYSEDDVIQHIWGGVEYAMGKKERAKTE